MNHSKKPVFKSTLDFEGRPLTLCLEKITEQKRMLREIRSALPAHIAEHVMHCVSHADRCILYTESAVWASQIRFFHQVILNKIHASGQQKIVRVQVKVLPLNHAEQPRRLPKLPSSEIAQVIWQQADHQSHDVLAVALCKLAKTLCKRLEVEVD